MTSPMRTRRPAWLLALVLAPGLALGMHPTTDAPSRVTVTYVHPHRFAESRDAGFGHDYNHGDYLGHLEAFLVRRAGAMLAPGQHLAISITDIDLAGGYEPWHGPQWSGVRFMRDVYPPRIDLAFTLTGADGRVIHRGSRQLRGLGYLHDPPAGPGSSDPLRYDKGLLERWLRRGPSHW